MDEDGTALIGAGSSAEGGKKGKKGKEGKEGGDAALPPFVVLPPCNAYLRKLVYQEIETKFPEMRVAKTDEDNTAEAIKVRSGNATC